MRTLHQLEIPKALRETYEYYSFSAIDPRGAFAYDSTAEWAAIAAHFAAVLWDATAPLMTTDPPLAMQEREFIEKGMVCWRQKGFGTLVVDEDASLVRSNQEQADALFSAMAATGVAYRDYIGAAADSELRNAMTSAPIPTNRGKGSPTWISGAAPLGAPALAAIVMGAATGEDVMRSLVEVSNTPLPICVTSYLRLQGSAKARLPWLFSGGSLKRGTTEAKYPKSRRVQALPFAVNYLVSQCAPVLRSAMQEHSDLNTGTIEIASAAVRNYKYSVAVDLSSYDESVSVETLTAYRTAVLSPCYAELQRRRLLTRQEVDKLISLDVAVQEMPLLSPPRRMGDAAELWDRAGGIVSGERLTSQKGTDINRIRAAFKARLSGLKAKIFNSGDDTIICTDDRKGLDRYLEKTELIGFTETVAPDLTYLMRRLPQGYAYVGRMLFNTLNRERSYEPTGVAQAAASIATRRELLRGHPLAHVFDVALATCPSPNLRAAAALSKSASALDLLLVSAKSATRSAQGIEEWLDSAADILASATKAQRAALAEMMRLMDTRSSMSYATLTQQAEALGLDAAKQFVSKTSIYK